MRIAIVTLLALAACAFEPGGPGEPDDEGTPDPGIPGDVDGAVPTTPDPPPPPPPTMVTCRVDGANLGVAGLVVVTPQGTHTFQGWVTSTSGGLVGFSIAGSSVVRYEVRTDRDRYWSENQIWNVPNGGGGVQSETITRIDFCAGDEGGGD